MPVPFSIDVRNKAKADGGLYPERYGYQRRGTVPSSLVIHSTEGKRGQTFTSAANFLYHSADVSAHFLVGRAGEVQQQLDPKVYQAWHAGPARPGFTNSVSIGIELLHARGEDWPSIQIAALAWLCEQLMARFAITRDRIETHRRVALPAGRKADPTDWPDELFYAWRSGLGHDLPADPFERWGPIARPEGDAHGYAIPRAWLMNQVLGACVSPETYSASGEYSVAEFTGGIIVYFKRRNAAEVYLF